MFTCPLCTKAFSSRGQLKAHTTSHTKEKPYKCATCSAAFGFSGKLNRHIKYVHEGFKTVQRKNTQCPLCKFKFRGRANLKVHLRTHLAELPYCCSLPGCGFKTKYERSLRVHAHNLHSNDERPYYDCPSEGCNYKGKSRQNLNLHLKVHSNEKPFACPVPGCNYICKIKRSLTLHTFRVHTDKKPFKCSTCDFRTNHRQSLKTHQDGHGGVERFQCQDSSCSYASHNKQAVRSHFDRKHRKKDVQCTSTGCRYRCGSKVLLNEHLKRHELPILKCPGNYCNFNTKFKIGLLKHITRMHGNLKSASLLMNLDAATSRASMGSAREKWQCHFPDCDYQTEFTHHYDRHMKTHDDEENRKIICPFCFSRFTNSHALKLHIQRHLGEKPYSCSYCGYAAVCSGGLRVHARKAHDIYVVPKGKEDDATKCRTCDAAFSSYSELVLHSMSHLRPVVVLNRLHVNTL